ncbi:hypothetical protein KM043_010067 [Ampulex compressa]|nr:hypothetical protein KM043_010067 [Ampulex compressa]
MKNCTFLDGLKSRGYRTFLDGLKINKHPRKGLYIITLQGKLPETKRNQPRVLEAARKLEGKPVQPEREKDALEMLRRGERGGGGRINGSKCRLTLSAYERNQGDEGSDRMTLHFFHLPSGRASSSSALLASVDPPLSKVRALIQNDTAAQQPLVLPSSYLASGSLDSAFLRGCVPRSAFNVAGKRACTRDHITRRLQDGDDAGRAEVSYVAPNPGEGSFVGLLVNRLAPRAFILEHVKDTDVTLAWVERGLK